MKPILKLLFVALLVGWVLSRPTTAKATDYWECQSGPMGACEQSAVAWMGQCTGGCPHQGEETQYCYSAETCNSDYTSCGLQMFCPDVPQPAISCIQGCINYMNQLMNSCYQSYCVPES